MHETRHTLLMTPSDTFIPELLSPLLLIQLVLITEKPSWSWGVNLGI